MSVNGFTVAPEMKTLMQMRGNTGGRRTPLNECLSEHEVKWRCIILVT